MRKMFKIKIYADGADYKSIIDLSKKKHISGFTTNPTLMRKSGVKDYKKFALKILSKVKNKPISFEVFSDDLNDMKKEALEINSWANNVYVKIPSYNTKGKSTNTLIKELSNLGIKLNVTALFTYPQVKNTIKSLNKEVPSIISIFCGRIADTGRDPIKLMNRIKKNSKNSKNIEILWASTRELYNIIQADKSGFNIITVPNNILSKMHMLNFNLDNLTLDTVKMFNSDALKSKFKII
jgi:transaldolase